MPQFQNILQAIGNTPIVKLNKVTIGCVANIYVKLEFMNPGGSIKDRIGPWMIDDAEKRGVLLPGGTLVVRGAPLPLPLSSTTTNCELPWIM